jgi:transketolase
MRVLPNMTVIVPCDGQQAFAATMAVAEHVGPCYLRLSREDSADLSAHYADQPFEIGKAQILQNGTDVTLIACGQMVAAALTAAELLSQQGVSAQVINMHTIKPLDVPAVLAAARQTEKLVTIEEHQRSGGLGSAVAEVVAEHHPVPVLRIGVDDSFGQSGTAAQLLEHFGLTGPLIAKNVKTFLDNRP